MILFGVKGEIECFLMEENCEGVLEVYVNLVEIFGKEFVYLFV